MRYLFLLALAGCTEAPIDPQKICVNYFSKPPRVVDCGGGSTQFKTGLVDSSGTKRVLLMDENGYLIMHILP